MLPILQIGPFALPLPGLIVIAGLWVGLSLAERRAPLFGVNPNTLYNLVFTALIAGILGARLSYAAQYPQAFLASPISLLSRDLGLLDPLGGLAIGIIAALIYGQRKGLPLWPTLDSLTPGLAVMGIALGLANLASGNAFGLPSDLPWAIELWGSQRHPTQIYDVLLGLVILWVILPDSKLLRTEIPGLRFLIFIAIFAGARLLVEGFRGDSVLIIGGLRSMQLVSWAALALGLWGIGRKFKDEQPKETAS